MIAAAAAAVLLIVGGTVWIFYPRPEPPAQVASDQSQPLKLLSKPSIAVLPFANLNNDPEQELFIDGLTNDIITDLSKFSTLFVIAANSTFRYKNQAVDVKEVARDLGVRYVLEGSVQRSNDTLRINAQLIDPTAGAHVWAERYDRPAKDFFAVQNDITRSIVGVVSPLAEGRGKLQKRELERIGQTATDNLQAYDYFLQGAVYMDKGTREDNLRSREMFEKAIELDPGYARAYGKNAWTYLLEYANGWTDKPDRAFKRPWKLRTLPWLWIETSHGRTMALARHTSGGGSMIWACSPSRKPLNSIPTRRPSLPIMPGPWRTPGGPTKHCRSSSRRCA